MNKYICCRSKKLFFSLNIFFPIYFKIQFPNRRTIMNIFLIFKTPPKKFQGSLTNCNKTSTAKTGVTNRWLLSPVSIFFCHHPNDDKIHRILLLSALATSMHEPNTLLNMHGVKACGRYAFNNGVHIHRS